MGDESAPVQTACSKGPFLTAIAHPTPLLPLQAEKQIAKEDGSSQICSFLCPFSTCREISFVQRGAFKPSEMLPSVPAPHSAEGVPMSEESEGHNKSWVLPASLLIFPFSIAP